MVVRTALALFAVLACSCAVAQKEVRPPEPPPAPEVVRQAPPPPVTAAQVAQAVEVHIGLVIPEGWVGIRGKDAGIPVFLVLRNAETQAMIFIDFFPAPPLEIQELATLARKGTSDGGAKCGPVTHDKAAGTAGFDLAKADGETKGRMTFIRRATRPDVALSVLGLWPKKHQKKSAAEFGGVVSSLTVK